MKPLDLSGVFVFEKGTCTGSHVRSSVVTRATSVKVFSQPWVGLLLLTTGFVLSHITGEQHRKQRKMMNPVFSINHMREMSEMVIVQPLCSTHPCAL